MTRYQSIFNRKKPLAAKTLQRIYAGLKKFGGPNAEPFLIVLRQHMGAQSINEPIPTLSAGGQHMALVQPEAFTFAHQRRENAPQSVNTPMQTLTASSSDFALVEPFLIGRGGPSGSGKPQSIEEPLNTVLTENHRAVVEPFILPHRMFDQGAPDSIERPLRTLVGKNARQVRVCEPVLIQTDHHGANGAQVRGVDKPVATITTHPSTKLVEAEAFLVDINHGIKAGENPETEAQRRVQSVNEPLSTVTTNRGKGVVEPCLVQYNGTATAQSINEPMNTVTGKDRYALVTTESGTYALDIRLRMLRPHELAKAMSLHDYKLMGKMEEQVKQIGNAVPVQLAKALCQQVIA